MPITLKANLLINVLNQIEGVQAHHLKEDKTPDMERSPFIILKGLKNEKGVPEGYRREFRKISKFTQTELEDLKKREDEIKASELEEVIESKLQELYEVDIEFPFEKLDFTPLKNLSFDCEYGIDYSFIYDNFFNE